MHFRSIRAARYSSTNYASAEKRCSPAQILNRPQVLPTGVVSGTPDLGNAIQRDRILETVMDRIKRPAPQLLCRVTAVVSASLFWMVLVRVSGGNVLDPTSSVIFAPAALAVVLGITIG